MTVIMSSTNYVPTNKATMLVAFPEVPHMMPVEPNLREFQRVLEHSKERAQQDPRF